VVTRSAAHIAPLTWVVVSWGHLGAWDKTAALHQLEVELATRAPNVSRPVRRGRPGPFTLAGVGRRSLIQTVPTGTTVTYAERILDYVWSVAPEGATNGELARHLGIRSQQTVYMLTQELMRAGRIRGERSGAIWVFHAAQETGTSMALGLARANDAPPRLALRRWPATCWPSITRLPSRRGQCPASPKRFDFVSPEKHVVGDAKYFTLVGGVGLPPAKFSIIAEHVWLLEKTGAPATFLVFGNDRQVPVRWLERYGELASAVTFYFLSDAGDLERLGGPCR
jgi:hypothetical protein